MKKTDYAHSGFMALYLASASSGQSFRVFKDIDIKDIKFEGFERNDGSMVMMEFKPTESNFPPLEAEYWVEIYEDELDRTLTLQIVDKPESENIPYILKLKIRSNGNITFNIEPSPFASSGDWRKWYEIVTKIKKSTYRRTYILDKNREKAITSSCPDLEYGPSTFEREVINNLSNLEEKAGKTIRPPYELTQSLLKNVNELNEIWDQIDDQERASRFEQFEEKYNNLKSTLITVQLQNERSNMVPMLTIHHLGWIDYSQLQLKFHDNLKKSEWNQIVKHQGEIKLVVNARSYEPREFFKELMALKSDGEFYILNMINKILEINSEVLPPIKTNLQIDFLNPSGLIQEIKVTIQQADDDYNTMEKLLAEEQYIAAIPYLEKLEVDKVTLAYGYALNQQYDEAIELANEIIRQDISTVAHMTKGLALVGKGNYNAAFEAYHLGVHICADRWYPIALENLQAFIKNNNIPITGELQQIVDLIGTERERMNPKQKCYCGSKKKFKKCHGKHQENN